MNAPLAPCRFHGADLSCLIDAWLAVLWHQRPGNVIVLAHAQRRWWPLLERAATVVWLHPSDDPRRDFHALPGCRPTLRPRLTVSEPAQAQDANELLSCAALRVGGVTDDARAVAAWLAPTAWRDGPGETLLWGRAQAAGWSACAQTIERLGLQPLPAPSGWRCLASAGLRQSAQEGVAWPGQGSSAWAVTGPLRAPLRLLQTGEPTWRLQLPGSEAQVASSELAQQRTMVWGRALTDRRGNFSLIRPWEGPLCWRALLPNVRVRLAELPLYFQGGGLRMARARWRDQALRLQADLPPLPEDQPAFFHGNVPDWALPKEDFCELSTLAWEWPA